MMRTGFIRLLFGVLNDERRFHKCRGLLEGDIQYCLHNKFDEPFVTYVFGKDNYRQLRDFGVDCRLVDPKPIVWDLDTQMMRHKLEAFKLGMEEFDEILFLDWDVLPIKPLVNDFWEQLRSKSPIQAILRKYKRTKAPWRTEDRGMIPCAAFVYIQERQIANELIQEWEAMDKPWSEEVVMASYLDKISGGWKGMDHYWKTFEPDFFVLEASTARAYPKEMRDSKDKHYHHFHKLGVQKGMERISKGECLEWESEGNRYGK